MICTLSTSKKDERQLPIKLMHSKVAKMGIESGKLIQKQVGAKQVTTFQ